MQHTIKKRFKILNEGNTCLEQFSADFGMSDCLFLVLVLFSRTFLDEVDPQVTAIESKHKGEEIHPFPLPCLSHCVCSPSPAPTVHPAKYKIYIYTSLSFTPLDVLLATRKTKKERRAHCHVDAASTCSAQGVFPNAAISHFPIDPAAVPVDAKQMVKYPCHTQIRKIDKFQLPHPCKAEAFGGTPSHSIL